MADDDDEAARARGREAAESGVFDDLSGIDYDALLKDPLTPGGEDPNNFGDTEGAGRTSSDLFPRPLPKLHEDTESWRARKTLHQQSASDAVAEEILGSKDKMNEEFCPDGKHNFTQHAIPICNEAEEFGDDLIAEGSLAEVSDRSEALLGDQMSAARGAYQEGNLSEANDIVSNAVHGLEQDHEITDFLDATLPDVSETYSVNGLEAHHCVVSVGRQNSHLPWNDKCLNQATLLHLKDLQRFIVLMGFNDLPSARHLRRPDGSNATHWHDSTLVAEVAEGGEQFYIELRQFCQEAYDTLVQVAASGGETIEFRVLDGSLKGATAQVADAAREVTTHRNPRSPQDNTTSVVLNWGHYALLLEEQRQLRKENFFKKVINKRGPVWKKTMPEEERCSGMNGNEDAQIRCDRQVYRNGRCPYHIIIEKKKSS